MRLMSSLLLGLFAAFVASAACAQDYPSRSVRIVVPYPPGGIDTVARLIGIKLSDIWKQLVLIENRPGASGVIGVEFVAKASPDGYTLLMTAGSDFTVTHHVYAKASYNPPNLTASDASPPISRIQSSRYGSSCPGLPGAAMTYLDDGLSIW